MLRWLRRRKRERILAEPFPEEWLVLLERSVSLWRFVPEASRPRLMDDLRIFLAERHWEACGGIELTEPMAALISAQACVLTLGRSVDAFDHVRSVLVYPDRYVAPEVWEDEDGIVTEDEGDLEGESWERGTVILSWRDLLVDARTLNGRNLVLHEFAHQLDLLDFLSLVKGVTPEERSRYARWHDTFLELFEAFCGDVDSGRKVRALDEYGAEDEAEFFAVGVESFFERGGLLQKHQPEYYALLSEFFNQDPASWPPPPPPPKADGGTARERRRKRRAAERKARKKNPESL